MRAFCQFAACLAITLVLLGTTGMSCCAASPAEPRHVLLLNSYHQNMTWVSDITQAVKDNLTADNSNIVLHVENMDSKRFHAPAYFQALRQTYQVKYRTSHFDLILSSDNNAFDFLRRYGDLLFPGIPVAFCGVNYLQPEDLSGHSNFTGVEEIFDAAATLEIALQNHPETQKVFIVNDYLKSGRASERTIREQLQPYSTRLQLDFSANLSLRELETQIAALEPGTIVLLGSFYSDREGLYVTFEQVGALLARASNVAVYCLFEFNVGDGVVGGNVISGYSQGKAVARLGNQILQGKPPASIPILRQGSNRNIFNYQQLQRFAISEAGLPGERLIINQTFSFYREYRTIIWLTSGVICFLLVTIFTLTINIRLRRKTERRLERRGQKLRAVFNHTFGFIGLLDLNGRLLDVNLTALNYAGVCKEAVVGQYFWETLWWQHSTEEQTRLRNAISLAQQGETTRYEATHLGADGCHQLVDVSVKPVLDEQGKVSLLIIEGRDLSERIAMEQALRESEDRLAMALEAANDGLWDWQVNSDQIYFNPTYYRMLGYREGEFPATFSAFVQRLHPDDKEKVIKEINRHLEDKTSDYRIEFRMRKKTGDWIWIMARGKITERDKAGKASRMIGIHSDISQRKQFENELRQARNYIRNIFNSMPSVLIGVDQQGLVTQWNKEAQQWTGTAAADAIGRPLQRVFPQLEPLLAKISSALLERKPQAESKVAFTTGAKSRFCDLTVYPLIADSNQGAVIRIDDTTTKVRMEEMIIQSDKMLSVGGLAAGMAHEINNPLAGVLQGAQVIKRRLDPSLEKNQRVAEACNVNLDALTDYLQQRGLTRMLGTIFDSGCRAADIVENMLNFSRKSESKNAPHSLSNILDKSLQLACSDYNITSLYDFKNIEIIKDYAVDMPDINCEETKIQQVFLNLLKNGAHEMFATQEDSPPPRFTLRLRHDDRYVRIEIEDNGPGMSADICKRVFEPFFTTKEVGVGTGLGLSVSYFIITEHHKGTMAVDSRLGQGSRFIIQLPLVEATDRDYVGEIGWSDMPPQELKPRINNPGSTPN